MTCQSCWGPNIQPAHSQCVHTSCIIIKKSFLISLSLWATITPAQTDPALLKTHSVLLESSSSPPATTTACCQRWARLQVLNKLWTESGEKENIFEVITFWTIVSVLMLFSTLSSIHPVLVCFHALKFDSHRLFLSLISLKKVFVLSSYVHLFCLFTSLTRSSLPGVFYCLCTHIPKYLPLKYQMSQFNFSN